MPYSALLGRNPWTHTIFVVAIVVVLIAAVEVLFPCVVCIVLGTRPVVVVGERAQ